MKIGLKKNIETARHKGFALRIRECLQDKFPGLSYKEIGKRLDVSDATIAAYVNGDKLPQLERCVTFCEVFDVNIDWLLAGKGSKSRQNYKGMSRDVEQVTRLLQSITDKDSIQIIKNLAEKFASDSV